VSALDTTVDVELDAMRRPFRWALLGVAIAFVLIGGLIAAFGTGRDRPEGAAEHWLTEVGDLTRKGVAEDAQRYVAEHGGADAVEALLPREDTDGKSAFTSLEVGKAISGTGGVRVPFVVELRDDAGTKTKGAVLLVRQGDSWHVVAVDQRAPGEKVPSEGGAAIAKAPAGLYGGAVFVGLLVTFACGALLRRAAT
jgi:hypothetical protein